MFKGKQHLPPHPNIQFVHLVVFPHDKPLEYQTRCLNGQWVIDLAKITKHDADLKIADTCGFAILESISEIGLLEPLKEPDAPDADRRVPGTDIPDMDEIKWTN